MMCFYKIILYVIKCLFIQPFYIIYSFVMKGSRFQPCPRMTDMTVHEETIYLPKRIASFSGTLHKPLMTNTHLGLTFCYYQPYRYIINIPSKCIKDRYSTPKTQTQYNEWNISQALSNARYLAFMCNKSLCLYILHKATADCKVSQLSTLIVCLK